MISPECLQLSTIVLYLCVLITSINIASASTHPLLRSNTHPERGLLPDNLYKSVTLNTGAGGCSKSQEAVLDIYRGATDSASGGSPTVLHLPGGAYMNLVEGTIDSAGSAYLRAGYTLAVLYYRLPRNPNSQNWLICSDPEEAMEDIDAAVRRLRDDAEEFYVDPSAIVAAGFSAGGHLAALHATRCVGSHSCPNAVVLHFPFLETGSKIVCTPVGGAFANQKDYDPCFPTALVDGATPPTVLYHASGDTLVSTREMVDFAHKLIDFEVPYEYYEVPGGGHYLVPFQQVADVSGGVFSVGDDYSSLVARALNLPPPLCVRCDDVAPDWMINKGQTCENGTWAIRNKCSSDEFWTASGFCRQSCDVVGRGYEGYDCCQQSEPSSCDNEPSPWMLSKGLSCEDSIWSINKYCNADRYWSQKKFCIQSCFRAGRGYGGDDCSE